MRVSLTSLFFLTGCINVDGLLPFFDNIHCSDVSEATCDPDHKGWDKDNDPDWDRICSACDEEYDWSTEHPWREKTLDGNFTDVRSIDPDLITRAPFEIKGGKELDAYFIASHGGGNDTHEATIVLSHGRYASIEHYMPRVRFLHELGFNVFVWDYRGFGKSEPKNPPSLPQMMSDAKAAFDHAKDLAPYPDKLIIYGMSVGGIPAGEMAANRDACAQIYEAAFNSVAAKIETNLAITFPGSFLTSGVMENDKKLADTRIPALILHGDADDRIHLDEATRLFESLPEDLPKEMVIIKEAGHGIGFQGGVPEQGLTSYGRHLVDFLDDMAPDCIADCGYGYTLNDGACYPVESVD